MPGRRRDPRYRYSAWRGGADPLAPPYDVRQALDEIGDRVLNGQGVRDAMRSLLRDGLPDADERNRRNGLRDLRARAERMRREASRRGQLDGAVTRARAQLDQALAAEREELSTRDGDDARFAEARLDTLPRSPSAAVAALDDYRWASTEAEQIYRQILEGLRNDVVDQQFRGMRDALQGMGPDADPQARAEAMRAMNEMMSDLNELLEKHARGEDTPEDFDRFMEKHGNLFPDRPENVEELIDSLARQAAAAQRLMESLTPGQRAELESLMQQAFGDQNAEMARLSDNLQSLRPDLNWSRSRQQMRGEQPLGYGEAADVMQELTDLDDLMDQLGQDYPGATLDDIDVDAVERALGTQSVTDVRRLQELERELQRQGWVTRGDEGLVLSAKALRRLGDSALRKVFSHLDGKRRGDHDVQDAGAAGEATGASREWRFGDEQALDVTRSLQNAVRRTAATGGPLGGSVALAAEDFEVVETERRTTAAVALCVDLSYSMVSQGRWGPMKQTALALARLAATRFPQDSVQIIGFGRYASPLTVEQLAAVEPMYEQGTNLQHALSIAGRHLRRHPGAEPVVLVVTDGEPTAHLEPDGEAWFDYPPSPYTIRATVQEVDALTRYGAAINTFMLADDPGLVRFIDAIARRNGGRVFTPDLENLGQYVVDDYIRSRRGRR